MGQLVQVKKSAVRIPAGHVSPGGAAGLKKLKGAAEEAAQSTWKRGLVGKANRDENSSIGATVVLRTPKVAHKASVTHAQSRSGAFAGKSRGVGRNLNRDENSSPGKAVVRTPSLRQINGKFAGVGEGVKVFHTGKGPGPRSPRDNRVQRWTKGGSKQAKAFVRKADDEPRKGMLGPVDMGSMQLYAGSRVGRRIPLA